MHQLVLFKMGSRLKPLLATRADERQGCGVGKKYMGLESSLDRKAPIAFIATEIPHPGMRQQVSSQVAAELECVAADMALVGALGGMNRQLVYSQARTVDERFVALVALVRLLTGVDLFMAHQVTAVLKGLATLVTHVVPLVIVRVQLVTAK